MAYLSASKLTFTQKFLAMSEDERMAEQVAAYEIVAKCGGESKGQWVLMTDNCLFSVNEYPDEGSQQLAQQAIVIRGAFEIVAQRAMPLDEAMKLNTDARDLAGI